MLKYFNVIYWRIVSFLSTEMIQAIRIFLCGNQTLPILYRHNRGCWRSALIARFMGPPWGPPGVDRTQVGPMLAPWTLLSGWRCNKHDIGQNETTCINYGYAIEISYSERNLLAKDGISSQKCSNAVAFLFHDVIMSLLWGHTGCDSVSTHQPHECLINRSFRRRSKEPSKLRVTGLCVGNSPVTGEFPAQMASKAENVSIWWRHHVNRFSPHTAYHTPCLTCDLSEADVSFSWLPIH